MSGTVNCYFYEDNDTTKPKCDISAAVIRTDIIFGKNQPFLGIEITVSKYMFDSPEFWEAQGFATCQKPIQNFTTMYISTYGGSYELIYTQSTNPDESTYVFMCYSKMYQMKNTEVTSLLSAVSWNGQSDTYNSGVLKVKYEGVENNVDLTGLAHITHRPNLVYDNIQIISPSNVIANIDTLGVEDELNKKVSIGTLRVLIPIYKDETIPIPAFEDYAPNTNATYRVNPDGTVSIIGASANTVYASVVFQYTVPISDEDLETWFKDMVSTHTSTAVQEVDNEGNIVEYQSTTAKGILFCEGIEYICGYSQAIFAWLSNKIGGYTGSDLVIDAGYSFLSSAQILNKNTYTKSEMGEIKAGNIHKVDYVCKLRATSNCYDSLVALATMTNRYAYYADRPYLCSFSTDVVSETLDVLDISYASSDSSYCAYFIPSGTTVQHQIQLGSGITYNDQGSTYLVGRQKAASKDTSVIVEVSDAGTDVEGAPVELNINTESIIESQDILAQIAFNTLMRNYYPTNTLSFIALENTTIDSAPDYDVIMLDSPGLPTASAELLDKFYLNTGTDTPNIYKCIQSDTGYTWKAYVPTDGQTCVVHTSYKTYYFVYNASNSRWEEQIKIINIVRDALFTPATRCKELYDSRSNRTLYNTPISYTVISWPDCATRYMFGEPVFQDTEQTISELQSVAVQSVSNTSINEAMNSSYSSLAIGDGSQSSGELSANFTGIIMQKNKATGVASIDGYRSGERQARFSSEGSISCGTYIYRSRLSGKDVEAGDTVVMDATGFKTRSWHLYSTEAPEYSYSDGFWRTECEISTEGSITAGAGSVQIGSEGIVTKDDDENTVYALNENGLTYYGRQIIDTATGKINLHVDTAVIDGNLRAISITLPYVQIDNYGLRTFNRYFYDTDEEAYAYLADDLQCSVGTNGIITAGAGAVKLDANGVTTYSGVLKADTTGYYSYENAIKECQMTTNGQFVAGNPMSGWSVMDSSGLKIYSKGADPTAGGINREPIVWVDEKGYHMDNSVNEEITGLEVNYGTWGNYVDRDGDIRANVNLLSNVHLNAGPVCYDEDAYDRKTAQYYSVVLHPKGLTTYSYEGYDPQTGKTNSAFHQTKQCEIDNTGQIIAGAGAVKLSSSGLTTYDITQSTPEIQCTVGTNGKITAGNNLVTLSDTGLIIGTTSGPDAHPMSMCMSNESSIEILGADNLPSVFIGETGTSFKNDVSFEGNISVGTSMYLGHNGSRLTAGTLNIGFSDGTTTKYAAFDSLIMSPSTGDTTVGTYNSSTGRFTSTFSNILSGYAASTNGTLSVSNASCNWTTPKAVWDSLIGSSSTNVALTFRTAKSPANWPVLSITGAVLNLSDILKTKPFVSNGELVVSGLSQISIPLSWTAATEGMLNETITVTIGYKYANYSGTFDNGVLTDNSETLINTIQYATATTSAGNTASNNNYINFNLNNNININGKEVYGLYVKQIVSIEVVVKLPLTQTLTIGKMYVGSKKSSSGGELFLSGAGVWVNTIAPTSISGNTITFKQYGIAPIANTVYVGDYVNNFVSNYSTDSTANGLKRVKILPSGSALPTEARDGDILIYYS